MRPFKMVKDSLGRECPNACYVEKDGMIEMEIEFYSKEDYQMVVEAAKTRNISTEEFINNTLRECVMDNPDNLKKRLEEVKDNE